MPASRATSRRLRLEKLRLAHSWLNAASIRVRRVFLLLRANTHENSHLQVIEAK